MTDLPLTPATALLLANFIQRTDVPQQTVSPDDGTILNPLPPAAIELAAEHGVREPGE